MSLLSVGQSHANVGLQGLQKAADLQKQRIETEKQLDVADAAQMTSNVATGAGIGMMAGMQSGSVGGPMGALIGAGIGYLASSLF